MTRNSLKSAGAAFAFLLVILGGFEGLRLVGYNDIAGVPTYCYGKTGPEAIVGKLYPRELCEDLLSEEGMKYWEAVDRRVKSAMTLWQWVAVTSWTYNFGEGALMKSTLLKLANQGDWLGACHELPKWNKARKGRGGALVVVWGLVKRRTIEMFICRGYIFDIEYSPNHRPGPPR
nr:lysozyme [uncultured Dongia sp.]